MNKVYTRINWENYPSEETALNETNLNKMDFALNEVDNRLIEQDTTKLSKTDASNDVVNWTIDEETGVITVTRRSGEQIVFDLNIEKIPVSFSLSDDGMLTMVTDDGTTFKANIGAMIPILTFNDSGEIAVTVTGTGINKTYSFSIKDNSITENKLQPNFLADIKVQSANASLSESNAETNATKAQSYAIGGTGTRENEDTDNAMYYYEQAKKTDIGQIISNVNEINRNLSQLEFGEVAGGKNISDFDDLISKMGYYDNFTKQSDGSYLFTSNVVLFKEGFVIDNISENEQYTFSCKIKCGTGTNFRFDIVYTDGTLTTSNFTSTSDFTVTRATSEEGKIISYIRFNWYDQGTFYIKDFLVEVGTTATDYEPYIPSVKMLAEEVKAQKNDLDAYADGTKAVAKATQDGNGNVISKTYAKKSEIYASDVSTISGMSYSAEEDEIIITEMMESSSSVADRVSFHNDALYDVKETITAVKQDINSKKVNKSDLVPSKFSGAKAIIGNQVSGGGGSAMHSYSTEEKVVGTWIDSKPLYQKTVVISNPILNVTDAAYPHNIENLDEIIDGKARYKRNDGIIYTEPISLKEANLFRSIAFDLNYIYMTIQGINVTNVDVTILYTKTTDIVSN